MAQIKEVILKKKYAQAPTNVRLEDSDKVLLKRYGKGSISRGLRFLIDCTRDDMIKLLDKVESQRKEVK